MTTNNNENIWNGSYKIPWDDCDFSRRMLAEHLSQEHDMASRRAEWIDRQVAWIHNYLLAGRPSAILDLGCGPGFYSHRLARLGHCCRGIDFGPASIEYASSNCPENVSCEFALGDIRRADYGGPYDLVMILYGEINVFSPDEASDILRKAAASLTPEGRLIIEVQSARAIECAGRSDTTEQQADFGLFSDGPHICRTESKWLAGQKAAIQAFHITDAASGHTTIYRSTTKAWSDDELVELLHSAGLRDAGRSVDWPCNTEALSLWLARKDIVI